MDALPSANTASIQRSKMWLSTSETTPICYFSLQNVVAPLRVWLDDERACGHCTLVENCHGDGAGDAHDALPATSCSRQLATSYARQSATSYARQFPRRLPNSAARFRGINKECHLNLGQGLGSRLTGVDHTNANHNHKIQHPKTDRCGVGQDECVAVVGECWVRFM
eukprot:1768011-Rhodomonas_salina.1